MLGPVLPGGDGLAFEIVDGNKLQLIDPQAQPGEYIVNVRAQDQFGAFDDASMIVTVEDVGGLNLGF